MAMRYNALTKSGNANGLTVGMVVGGNTLDMGDNARLKVHNLSAHVTALADTSTFTWTAKWQVSNDGTAWVDVANDPQNAAAVTLATGTAGADTAVERAFDAPLSVYGWKKARIALVTGGTTGATIDTYTLAYCYRTA